jgi:DNA-binding NtrC family response regulator
VNTPASMLASILNELENVPAEASLYLRLVPDGPGFFVLPARSTGFQTTPEQVEKLNGRLASGRSGRTVITADPSLINAVLPDPVSRNLALIPVRVDDTSVGSLNVGIPDQPDPSLIDDLRDRASRIAIALGSDSTSRSERRRDLQLNLINRLGRQDAWQMPLDSFLELAVVSIREGLDYYNVSVFVMDPDRSELRLAAHASAYRGRVTRGFRQDIGLGMLGWTVRNGRMLLANDVSKEEHYQAVEGLLTASEICLPIVVEGQVEGVLNVESDEVNAFDEGDVVALQALSQQISDVIQMQRKNEAFESLRVEMEDRHRFGDLLGRSSEMRQIFELIQTVSPSDLFVLVRGETGTGKELVARAIHRESDRRTKPFVAVNCAALPESLFEDELFGHERGAFTGADRQRLGKLELARGGTLFLDEVGEISYAMQAKLLRAIAENKITRVGGEKEIDVDVRVISATNRPQEELEQEGTFRQDLYFRLNAIQIDVPPLRSRIDDIPLLAAHFLKEDSDRYGKAIEHIDPDLMAQLMTYSWPGNVRQLENVIGRAVLMESGTHLSAIDLPDTQQPEDEVASYGLPEGSEYLRLADVCKRVVGEVERAYLREILIRTRGNLSEAARQAGVTRRTLYNKLASYGMKRDDFLPSS